VDVFEERHLALEQWLQVDEAVDSQFQVALEHKPEGHVPKQKHPHRLRGAGDLLAHFPPLPHRGSGSYEPVNQDGQEEEFYHDEQGLKVFYQQLRPIADVCQEHVVVLGVEHFEQIFCEIGPFETPSLELSLGCLPQPS